MDYEKAKQYLTQIRISECLPYFKSNGMLLEEGYCELLEDRLDDAKITFDIIKERDLRADWAILLIQFMKNYIQEFPSYLQIRNFLEIDLSLLLNAKKLDYVENIINAADIFFQINQESYKFIARVLLNHNYPTIAQIFLKRGVEYCYKDPELHFLYGSYYLLYNRTNKAKQEFEKSLEVLPEYYPAKMMLNKLNG